MAIMVYDPTRGYLVTPEQARVVAYVVDTDTNQRYSSVAAAQAAQAKAAPAPKPTPEPAPFIDPQDIRDPKTGLTPAQVAAQEAVAQATAAANALGITTATNVATPGNVPTAKYAISTTFEGTGKNKIKITKFNDGTESREAAPEIDAGTKTKKETFRETLGEGLNRFIRVYYDDNTYEDFPSPFTPPVNVTSSATAVTATTVTPVVTAASNVMTTGQQDVYSIMLARLNQYNLGALAPLIRKLAIEGATEATIMLQLSEEPLYKERFKANEIRKQKGLSVLNPSQYLTMEDDYRQILRAYGLSQFDNDAYVSQFISNDVSPTELSNRVVTAVQRVRNADPAVSNMLKNLYGIGQNDLVAYVLDPQQQFQKIERQVAASEIGVAAARQGFNIGATVAEQLAAQGISQAEAQKGYSTIADILPTAEKLSDIYGGQLESYRLPEAEQEVFNQLASAQRKRRALTERELATFSGQSGVGRTSLTQQTGGTF